MSITPKYRLAYFDVRALGEPIRWIFQYTKTPFIDERIPWDYPQWFAETKKKYISTVGQVPVLYEDGMPELSQSQVISRYLAKKFGLVGSNDWEDAKIDEVICMVFDAFVWWRMMVIFERDQERKQLNRKTQVDPRFKLYYGKWNRIIQESGGPYILGKKLTHADFWLANFISIWDDPMAGDEPVMPPGFNIPCQDDMFLGWTKDFPALKAHKETITSIPEIKEWITKRHQTII